MTVLITGAGLVAAHVAAGLRARGEAAVLLARAPDMAYLARVAGADVAVERGDIRDLPGLIDLFQRRGVRRVVHTAAMLNSGAVRSPAQAVETNVQGTLNVLDAARLTGARRVVSFASIAVFDHRVKRGAIREDHPTDPATLYGVTKLAAEQLGVQYRALFGLEFTSLRIPPVYGLPPAGHSGAGAGPLLHHVLRRVLRGEPVAVDRAYLAQNELLYVHDAARAAILAAYAEAPPGPRYNIGTGRVTFLPEIMDIVRATLPEARITLPPAPADVARAIQTEPFDVALAARELGFHAEWTLERGVADYVARLRA